MLALKVDFDYLVADAQEWIDDVAPVNEELTELFEEAAELMGIAGDYVDGANLEEVLAALGFRVTGGLYNEDGPVRVAMCNEDTFLDQDLSFTFAHVEELWPDESVVGYFGPIVLEDGHGYFAHRLWEVVVRDFAGYDDADMFSYSRGGCSHVEDTGCEVDWILDDPSTLWPNGGQGPTVRVDDAIIDGTLTCPECGGELAAYVY